MSRWKENDVETNPEEVKKAHFKLEKRMRLEARRDFLISQALQHEIKLPEYKAAPQKPIIERLAEHIHQLEAKLKLNIKDKPGLQISLLPKIGDDNAGISTTLAKQFSQLSQKNQLPYVALTTTGIQFYWENPEDGNKFAKLMEANGFNTVTTESTSLPSEIESQIGLREKYKDCTMVTFSHLQAETLLDYAQYHPQIRRTTLVQWYEARGYDRATCVAQAVTQKKKNEPMFETKTLPVLQHGNIQRVRYDEKKEKMG